MAILKDGTIVINNFEAGLAKSAYFGFEELRGLDITTKPGIVRANIATSKETGTTVTGLIGGMVSAGTNAATANVWAHDGSTKKVYLRTAQDTWAAKTGHTSATIYGICYYKSYVGIIFLATVEWYKISDNTFDTAWSASSITSGSTGSLKPWCIAQDDALYIGSGNYVDKVVENSGQNFAPGTSASYTISKAAVDLPEGEAIKEIIEMGDWLFLVCDYKIYPWDKSATSFNSPINFNKYINQAIAYNNRIYVQAGFVTEWFVTDGSSVQKIGRIPETLIGIGNSQVSVYRPCIRNELIYFGAGGSASFTPKGVYSLNPETGAFALEHLISTGGYATTYTIEFGPLLSLGYSTDAMLIPWSENSVYGIDRLAGSTRYTSDISYLTDQFYRVGTRLDRKTYQHLEIQLAKVMASGDSVKVYYRTTQNGSWTLIKTFAYSTQGAVSSYNSKEDPTVTPPKDVENIQLKVIVNANVELLEVRLT